MKTPAIVVALGLLAATPTGWSVASNGHDLFQQALVKERTEGDLDAAIRLHQQIVRECADDRPLAARALLRLGQCYEKLGRDEARKAYERLVQEYADQAEPVRVARQHLEQLDGGATQAASNRPTYRLVLDSSTAGMPVTDRGWVRTLDFSPSGDRIVFESQGKLHVADETGTVIRPILDDFSPWEKFTWPRWSPDGRQIAYLAWKEVTSDSGEMDSMLAVFVVSPDGGSPRQVTPDDGRVVAGLRWTADGQHLTLMRKDGIHTLDLDGNEVRFVPGTDLPGRHHIRNSDGEYSPDGRWLAYCAFRQDPSRGRAMWILPADGGQARVLRLPLKGCTHPTWAPDGRILYYVSREADTSNLWRVAIDPETGLQAGEAQQITFFNEAEVTSPRVLGDGGRIAFDLQRANTSIYVANGSLPHEPRVVARGYPRVPQVSPDGQTIYYVHDGICAVSREGSAPRRLTDAHPPWTNGTLPSFHLAPDGRTIAYVAKSGEGLGLFVLPVSGGTPQLLVKITGLGVAPQWAPDGTLLAYADGHDLLVIGASGGQPRRVAHLEDSGRRNSGWVASTVRWSPDGKFIAAIGGTARPESNRAVFAAPASGGELRQLTPDGPEYLDGLEWHPDGQRLSYNVTERESETRQAYLDGRPPTLLVNHADGWDYIGSWAPDGRRFLFLSEPVGEMGYDIFVHDEAVGGTTLFANHGSTQGPPRWSRDGSTVAWWATRKTERQAWVMEDFQPEVTAAE